MSTISLILLFYLLEDLWEKVRFESNKSKTKSDVVEYRMT